MVYSYWKNNNHNTECVFSLYFRKNPFGREFTIFAGLSRFIEYVLNFKITKDDLNKIKLLFSDEIEDEFYEYLLNLNLSGIKIYAVDEGMIVFPSIPLVQIVGPIAILQLFETILLNLTNFASLVATNAAHFRIAAGSDIKLMEFGCRRAQGPDGALSSSIYSYIGGFDGTSNIEAGVNFNIPISGTIGHSFISSYSHTTTTSGKTKNKNKFDNLINSSKLKLIELKNKNIIDTDLVSITELEAFVAFAQSFYNEFLVIIDTYNVLLSGLPNFIAVSLALYDLGYQAKGIRLDSGDLAYLSIKCRELFTKISQSYNLSWFTNLSIVASNEITVESIYSMNLQKHQINIFGIGTHLVTCTSQSSLGMIYKLVEYNNQPTLKITEDYNKITIPFKKKCYRLYGSDGLAILDLLTLWNEDPPKSNEKIICYHPYLSDTKITVIPTNIKLLTKLIFENNQLLSPTKLSIDDIKNLHQNDIKTIRNDYLRYINPTPFKISLSFQLLQAFIQCKSNFPLIEYH